MQLVRVPSREPLKLVLIWALLVDLRVCESGDVEGVERFVLDRGAPARGAVASLPVVEDLQVLKRSRRPARSGSSTAGGRAARSASGPRAQKDSMTALMPYVKGC